MSVGRVKDSWLRSRAILDGMFVRREEKKRGRGRRRVKKGQEKSRVLAEG